MSNTERDLTTTRTQVFGEVEKGTECRVCGRNVDDGRSKVCSDYCRNLLSAVMGMLNWNTVRRRVLERDDHTCTSCGFKQEWLDRGHEHIRDIVENELPEEPEAPSILRIGKGEVSDKELERSQKARNAWERRRSNLIRKYYRLDTPRSYSRWPSPEKRLEVDHIKPISEGGHPFDPGNLQTLCEDCHEDKTAEEASARADRRTPTREELNESLFSYADDASPEGAR